MNRKKWLYLMMSIFVGYPSFVFSLECERGEMRFFYQGKQKQLNETYCQMKYQETYYFLSKSCEIKKCRALKKVEGPVFVKALYSEYGTPSFKICHALGGNPHIVSFRWKGKWVESDRCVFEQDQSFVESSYLFHKWKYFISER